ncbi:MAG TPA: hypothetical protein VG845_02980 [Dehalococcoidia bacterium]|nr:hypothetical protein [Dehalococcoidia bacterium]
MYVVVEIDPATGENHVLIPRSSMVQIHPTLQSAESHRNWYIDRIYVEDTSLGDQQVRIYRLEPV